MKKVMKITGNILYTLIFSILLLLTVIVISSRASGGEPELFGYQLKTVLSGSMEPTFNTGSLILVKKFDEATTLDKGDIITFRQDETNVVTHRIIEVVTQSGKEFYRTQGDNNEDPDTNLVMTDNLVAKYTGITIPLIGYFLQYASTPLGTALLLIIPGLILLGYSALTIRQGIREIEGKLKNNPTVDSQEKTV